MILGHGGTGGLLVEAALVLLMVGLLVAAWRRGRDRDDGDDGEGDSGTERPRAL
jgi:hypothetical protein